MTPGLRASASGMQAQQLRIDTIANNLANVSTTGFKRSRASFEDMLYETLQGAKQVDYQGAQSLAPIQIGRGVRLAAIDRVDSQGTIETTNRPFDLAIEGDGYFQIQMPDGSTNYTRDGNFRLSDSGTLVTESGYEVMPPITVPADSTNFTVSPTGVVSVTVGQSGTPQEIGQLELVRFANPSGLTNKGGNLFGANVNSGDPMSGSPNQDGYGQIVQNSLESSNVEIVQEMVDMITAQRAYEVNSKAIKTADDMISTVTDELIR
jgi:flagellar basal-body rod protein FlgG